MTGFVADSVAEVLRLPASAIEKAPSPSATSEANYVAGVAMLNDRLMMVLDVARLVSLESLQRFAAEELAAGLAAQLEREAVVGDEVAEDAAVNPETPARPGLADLDIALQEATFEAAKPRAAELTELFYASLFEQHPAVIPLFEGVDIREQQGKLIFALARVIASLRQPDAAASGPARAG